MAANLRLCTERDGRLLSARPAAGRGRGMNVLWLQAAGCGGCTMSLLCAEAPNAVRCCWTGPVCASCGIPPCRPRPGPRSRALLDRIAAGALPLDILCVEGAIAQGPRGTGRYQMLSGTGRSMLDWVRDLAPAGRACRGRGQLRGLWRRDQRGRATRPTRSGCNMRAAIAGGVLPAEFRAQSGLPVINVAGCPTHPDWVTETLMLLAAGALGPGELDGYGPAALLRRASGPSRLPEERVLRIQGQRPEALRNGLHDGASGLCRHPGGGRLQHPALERFGQLHARRAFPASPAPRPNSRNRATPSPKRPRSRAFPSACHRTCPRRGSWRSPRCPRPPRPNGCRSNAVADRYRVRPRPRNPRG
jgi:hypothetical protein